MPNENTTSAGVYNEVATCYTSAIWLKAGCQERRRVTWLRTRAKFRHYWDNMETEDPSFRLNELNSHVVALIANAHGAAE